MEAGIESEMEAGTEIDIDSGIATVGGTSISEQDPNEGMEDMNQAGTERSEMDSSTKPSQQDGCVQATSQATKTHWYIFMLLLLKITFYRNRRDTIKY